jgi:AcrR family transcriptional regulator
MARAGATKGSQRPQARVGDAGLVEQRRAQIVEAATRLVARQGFARTVVRDIAEEAGISVGLVYQYVRSKEDILFLVYEHWSAVWAEGLGKALSHSQDPLARIEDAVDYLVRTSEEHPEVIHLYYRESGHLSDQGREMARHGEWQMLDQLLEPVNEAIAAGLLRPETDASVVAAGMVLLSHGYVLKGDLLREDHTASAYAAAVVDTAIRGWATPAGRKARERRRRLLRAQG